jgi:hypothetical protein
VCGYPEAVKRQSFKMTMTDWAMSVTRTTMTMTNHLTSRSTIFKAYVVNNCHWWSFVVDARGDFDDQRTYKVNSSFQTGLFIAMPVVFAIAVFFVVITNDELFNVTSTYVR